MVHAAKANQFFFFPNARFCSCAGSSRLQVIPQQVYLWLDVDTGLTQACCLHWRGTIQPAKLTK